MHARTRTHTRITFSHTSIHPTRVLSIIIHPHFIKEFPIQIFFFQLSFQVQTTTTTTSLLLASSSPWWRCHYASIVGTFAIRTIVFHSEIMTQLVCDRCGNQTDHGTVIHENPTAVFESAYRSFQCFSYDSSVELNSPAHIHTHTYILLIYWKKKKLLTNLLISSLRQQLSIIVWMFLDQKFFSI